MSEKAISEKIFCIGLNKTGTTSLHKAFQILGLNSVHHKIPDGQRLKTIMHENLKSDKPILHGLEHYDAFLDWNGRSERSFYKIFDKTYPNSKFILTVRNLDDWLDSREKHVLRNREKKQITGDPNIKWLQIDREAWTKEYWDYHREIDAYFSNRNRDLLKIDITAGEGWETLCPFLNHPIPNTKFPHKNKAEVKKVRVYWLKIMSKIKSLFRRSLK